MIMSLPITRLLFAVALFAFFAEGCSTARTAKHVVLISLDGSRPDFYMDTSWPAPHLQRLKEEGVYAAGGIRSVFPSVTYPSHTTLVTGAFPARHGIYYNVPIGAKKGHWYWNENAIKCETLWEAVKDAGMTSGAVFWPVSVGAPINYNFPVRRVEAGETGNNLTIKLPFITPPGLLKDIENKTGRKFTASDLTQDDYAQSKTIGTIACYIIKTYKPNLMAIHFVGIDHKEHEYGREGAPVREVVRVTDSLVGTVLQAIKEAGIEETTTVIVTGDHGFADNRAYFKPNVYLARHGLIKAHKWAAKFHAAGGSSFLYLGDKADSADVLDSVVALLKATPEYHQGYFRMLDRKTLDSIGADPHASLALAMKEGISARNGTDGPASGKNDHGGGHGYDPAYRDLHTGFIAVGAGISAHKNIAGMGIKDVAPVVAKLLGLSFKAPDGVLIPGILADKGNK
jgi:predicted AlkP superfamily phosphohydrolase/phosphomutase